MLQEIPEPTHYSYRVLWSPEDEEFVGLCAEFPSLSWLAETQSEAIDGIVDLVREVLKDMVVNHEAVPRPLSERRYSGKFMVRTSAELHARLVREAKEQGLSLNQLASQRLAQG
jgi:predicted HicB family RNase H-like nuclease